MGKGINPDGLDAKTRLLLTLQGLTIQGAQAEPQIRLTVRHAVEAGATTQEIAETIALAGAVRRHARDDQGAWNWPRPSWTRTRRTDE